MFGASTTGAIVRVFSSVTEGGSLVSEAMVIVKDAVFHTVLKQQVLVIGDNLIQNIGKANFDVVVVLTYANSRKGKFVTSIRGGASETYQHPSACAPSALRESSTEIMVS